MTTTAAGTGSIEALFLRFRRDKDAAALATLFDRTAPGLFRIALSVAPDAATAEEAVQETFLALLEDPHRCDLSKPLMPWLVGVLRHKVLDARRRERRVPDPLSLEPRILPEDPADAVARRDAVDRVRAALDRLPEPYRTVAMLRWEYGLEPGEIAHARGEPPGTVRSTLSRALERLRKDLGGWTALAICLGVRPADGLASIRRNVLVKAGFGGAATTALLPAGLLVTRISAASALALALVVGMAGGGAIVAGRQTSAASPTAPTPSFRTPAPSPDETPPSVRPAPRRAVEEAPARDASAPPPASAPDEVARAETARLLAGLDGTWVAAWKIGQDLAQLTPPRPVVDLLRDRWPRLGGTVDRQNLMKGFSYDASNELRLEVFQLGVGDVDPRVRLFALTYLEPYAGRRLTDDPAADEIVRTTIAGRDPAALLEAAAARVFARLREAAPAERADLLDLLQDVLSRRRAGAPALESILDAATAWLEDPEWAREPRPLLRVVATARPPEARARALFDRLLNRGGESERLGLQLAGVLQAPWTYDAVLARLRSTDTATACAAARALADLDELGAFRPLAERLAGEPDPRLAAAIATSLERLTNVSRWRGKSPAWWEQWWKENGDRFEEAIAREEKR